MRELLPKVVARAAFEAGDDLGNAQCRVRLDEQVNVVGHNLEGVNDRVMLASNFLEQRLEPGIDRTNHDRAPI
jgi:hypothetical protein